MGGMSAAPRKQDDELAKELRAVLGSDTEEFLGALAEAPAQADPLGTDISALSAVKEFAGGLGRLLLSSGTSDEDMERRLPALLTAFKANQKSTAFDRTQEGDRIYGDAAEKLAQGPIKHVVFGHTHLPKKVGLGSGGYYLNSGTWADVLRFPVEILDGTREEALAAVREFVEAMKRSDFSAYTTFQPTYVRLDVGENGTVVEAELCDWEG